MEKRTFFAEDFPVWCFFCLLWKRICFVLRGKLTVSRKKANGCVCFPAYLSGISIESLFSISRKSAGSGAFTVTASPVNGWMKVIDAA